MKGVWLVWLAIGLCGSAHAQEMIDVGPHKLAMKRMGEGAPTVVLESGGGPDIEGWNLVMPAVGGFTSVIAYARAGRGHSEPAARPQTATNVVDDLRTLLRQAGYPPPYVLVGRSIGGLYVRAFAMMYPAEVAGLVLVDGSHERQGIELARARGISAEEYRAGFAESLNDIEDESLRREISELKEVFATGDLGIARRLPDIPMIVLTNTKPEGEAAVRNAWRQLHSELFEHTTHGMHIVTNKSGHRIADHEPDLVISAIRWVVDTARQERIP